MFLDSWINLETWITFRIYILSINDTFGTLRDTVILRYGTMCNLRYVDRIADKAASCHLVLNPFGVRLMQHSYQRKSTLRTALAMK